MAKAQSFAADGREAVVEVARALGPGPHALVVLFASPVFDREALAAAAARELGGALVVGCTTAGEIAAEGYVRGALIGVALPAGDFSAAAALIPDLSAYSLSSGPEIVRDAKSRAERPDLPEGFALLLSDGMARMEDALLASFAPALGDMPIIGGSAGDGLAFEAAFVLHDGRFHRDAAVLTVVRTRRPIRVFRFDHFRPTERRMVVTDADPELRLVKEINAEPAAREYARLVGKDPEQLSPFTFAAHPVLVKIGGQHYVRSIQKVEPNGDLRFYSAIDVGLVLTAASSEEIAAHLDGALASLGAEGAAPELVLGFDCILRRLEAEERQAVGRMSEILRRHGVVGFNTYGEQWNMLHVNQTLTGVAIYPAAAGAAP